MSTDDGRIIFKQMFDNYVNVQKRVSKMVTSISMNSTNVQPGKFLMLQFMMGNLSQIGDSISNVVSSMNAIAKNSISNMRG